MRKLLLTSSALVAAASISSYAVADVSVTGGFEWKYTQQAADLTANDGDSFHTDNEIVISFSNKTDSGLTVGGKMEMGNYANNGANQTAIIDESVLTISGGFGTFRLGQEDSMHESFGITEVDLIDEEGDGRYVGTATHTIAGNAGEQGSTDTNKIGYVTPAMGGFKAGYSLTDTGASGTTDQIAMGASYSMPLAGGSMTIKYNKQTTDGTTATETEGSNYGVSLTMGAISAIASTGSSTIGSGTGQTDDRNASGLGIKYDLGGGMTIAATTMKAEDDKDVSGTQNEEYSANLAEVVYTVAPGLSAKVTYLDYDYKAGGESLATNDSGSKTQFTLSASF